MLVKDIVSFLETLASPTLQESYDNSGLITGNRDISCTGVICTLDATEAVIDEAITKGCNLVVAHHPILFKGLKTITGNNYVERTMIKAIKNDIAIYAIHTNLDNVLGGVNGRIASMLGLTGARIAAGKPGTLKKLYTFCPTDAAEKVRQVLFEAGGGHIGNYSECSFNAAGTGTFKGGPDTNPFAGTPGTRHEEPETRIEIVFPAYLEAQLITALREAHPYEEVAFDVVALENANPLTGAGIIGQLPEPVAAAEFLGKLQQIFHTPVIRHSSLPARPILKVMVCGGAGSFLIQNALRAGVDAFVTADLKYHEFFDADGRMLLADIGHYESEQYTTDLLQEVLAKKFPTFAVLKTAVLTNAVHYFGGHS